VGSDGERGRNWGGGGKNQERRRGGGKRAPVSQKKQRRIGRDTFGVKKGTR